MDLINQGAATLNEALDYIHENKLPIVVGLLVILTFKNRVKRWTSSSRQGSVLSTKADSVETEHDRLQEIARIRVNQQEELQKRSIEAAKLRKTKELEDRTRRNEAARAKALEGGRRLGRNDSSQEA
jgi:biopolymer transport protein ExbB/TolQ